MNSKNHIIIYSHGFSVRKDDRGLLSEIASVLPEAESILFDYYDIDEEKKILTIRPISDQAEMLNVKVKEAREAHPDAIIDIIAHSQGCVVAAIAKPEGVRKTLLLAPVFDNMTLERTLSRYESQPGVEINLEGISKLTVLDGLLRIVPAEYWRERKNIKTFDEYNSFAEKTELIAIEAEQDNILPKMDLSELSEKVEVISLPGDHSFGEEDSRNGLISAIRGYII